MDYRVGCGDVVPPAAIAMAPPGRQTKAVYAILSEHDGIPERLPNEKAGIYHAASYHIEVVSSSYISGA